MKSPDVEDRLQQALGGAYAIERELAAGGMSRVFVADEAALGRKVVIKVLRPELAEGLSARRFEREVRFAARLQHPHIVPVLAAGELPGGALYYTMPFVDGESLRARLVREGGLPIAETVRILRDVASALAYAHRAGVVHRDVKPDNVLLSQGGAVVADFGIAKAVSASRETDGGDEVRAATLTAAGTSLGTPAYMAPEQAAGDVADHRADLYALGVVAYEMLAGRAPFEGRNTRELLSAHVVEVPTPLTKRRPGVPPSLGALVMRLLEKHPGDRPQSADEVVRALDGLASAPAGAALAPRAGRRLLRVPTSALVAAVAALAGGALGALLARPGEVPSRPVVATLTAPADQELRPELSLALSPDGARLAFVAADRRGGTAIWVRPLDSLAASLVNGTDGGSGPFWSPDGASLGFFAGGQLKVADLRAGTRRALCPAPRPGGGTWTTSGTIVFSPDFLGSPLFRVPAGGGPCTQLTRYRPGDFDYRRPSALPDGRHVLFSSFRGNLALAVDLATGEVTEVRQPGNEAQFAAPDWLLFRDQTVSQNGPLYAQRLDMRTLRPIGEARVVLDRVVGIGGLARFTATSHVLVAVRPSGRPWSLVWVNRESAITDSVLAPAEAGPLVNAANVGLSRDGRWIAFGGMGMWIHNRDRNVATAVGAQTMAGQGILDPAWGPSDTLIAYGTVFKGPVMLRVYNVRTGRSDSLFASGRRNVRSPDWSPDGGRIAFQLWAGNSAPRDEIWVYSLAQRRASRLWAAAGNLASPRWSPDGQWLAYVSDETGAPEVYLRRVAGGVPTRVSTAGGGVPRWGHNGRELYYRVPSGAVMAVDIRLRPTLAISTPRVAVAGPPFSQTPLALEVTPDGERFAAFEGREPAVFTLLLDWTTRLPPR